MSCIVLIGGGIGCGKSTLIKYIFQNKNEIFNSNFTNNGEYIKYVDDHNQNNSCWKLYTIQFDSLCPIDEQKQLMKTLKGWRDFRADLLMAAEHFIAHSCKSKDGICLAGPLSERSYKLFENLIAINGFYDDSTSDGLIFVEDNFYYRSMRYDWFQIARRNNLGFSTVFVQCPLSTAIYRNSIRGYHIPDDRIRKIFSFIESPDPVKYKWEKYSLTFDSSLELNNSSLSEIVDVIREAVKHPAERIIMEEKIEAQKICSKSVIHQTDKILRRILTKKILRLKDICTDETDLKSLASNLVTIRQKLLTDIKQNCFHLPQDLVEKIQDLGIESVLDAYEETLTELFNNALEENSMYQFK